QQALQPFPVEVRVAVREPGHQRAARELHDAGVRADMGADLAVGAHGKDALAPYRDRSRGARGAVERQDVSASQHEIGGRSRQGVPLHSGLMPASFTIWAYLAKSSRMMRPNSSGVVGATSLYESVMRFATPGSESAVWNARFSLSSTGRGRPTGAMTPCQPSSTNPGWVSEIVGRPGSGSPRLEPVSATGRILSARICGSDVLNRSKRMFT